MCNPHTRIHALTMCVVPVVGLMCPCSEKMRSTYGKLVYLLMDSAMPAIQEPVEFQWLSPGVSCARGRVGSGGCACRPDPRRCAPCTTCSSSTGPWAPSTSLASPWPLVNTAHRAHTYTPCQHHTLTGCLTSHRHTQSRSGTHSTLTHCTRGHAAAHAHACGYVCACAYVCACMCVSCVCV